MTTTLHLETTVLPGTRVEFSSPELTEGAHVLVTVVMPQPSVRRLSMLKFLQTLPPGPLVFKTPAEVDEYLQEERNAWDR